MPEYPAPPLEDFARQFRQKYGREMTPQERRFYDLTKTLLDNPPEEDREEKKKDKAA